MEKLRLVWRLAKDVADRGLSPVAEEMDAGQECAGTEGRRMMKRLPLFILLVIGSAAAQSARPDLKVSADFSGGAVKAIDIDQKGREITFGKAAKA